MLILEVKQAQPRLFAENRPSDGVAIDPVAPEH